jgi:hypothetical protein
VKIGMRLSFSVPCALALVLFWGCVSSKYVPKANEELYGTWTNELISPAKMVTVAGGFKDFESLASPDPVREGTQQIAGKWKDAEGSIWYQTYDTITAGDGAGLKVQSLFKLSKSGTVLEAVHAIVASLDPHNFPTAVGPGGSYYTIYYRSQE